MSGSRQRYKEREAVGPAASGAASSVYGPVRSWRAGLSLGVDLLFVNSICSFRCVYCQLGKINLHTMERKVYVPTGKVMDDLRASAWREADVITLSGSGEPTLAANMGEVISEIKRLTGKPVLVLTNSTTLNDKEVRSELSLADRVYCKLDASDEAGFRTINRPVAGITLRSVIEGIRAFKAEYDGHLAIQVMLMRMHGRHLDALAGILKEIGPHEVQLNAPLRPIPRGWFLEARGNYPVAPYPAISTNPISREEARQMETALRESTCLKVTSVYR
jgi:wyosine [tRNA(Phe)-imidazoG37] synthetase (radical SAM superfamily)